MIRLRTPVGEFLIHAYVDAEAFVKRYEKLLGSIAITDADRDALLDDALELQSSVHDLIRELREAGAEDEEEEEE